MEIGAPFDLVRKTFAMKNSIHKDFFAGSQTTVYTDSLLLNILTSEFDCMESITVLLEKERSEDCYILMRHILETFPYLWLMLEGEIYQFTREYRIIPNKESTKVQARDKTYEKWIGEKKSGLPQFKDVIDIQKGKEDDVIKITYQCKGLFTSKDPKEADRIIPWYVFAFQEYDPDTRFLAELPSFCSKEPKEFQKILRERSKKQRMLYHRYFYVKSIIRNLRLNQLLTSEQVERVTVHYNFFSSFLHPNKRIIRTKSYEFSYGPSQKNVAIHSELVLLYLCRFQFLLLSKFISYFRKHYLEGKYKEYEKHAGKLDEASRDLWFFDNEPSAYDLETSRMRIWWLERSGESGKRSRV